MKNEVKIRAKMLSRADGGIDLSNFPNVDVCGLKAIFYLENNGFGVDSVYITNEIAEGLEMSTDDLLAAANESIAEEYHICTLADMCQMLLFAPGKFPKDLEELTRSDEPRGVNPYIIMTDDMKNAAAVVLNKDILDDVYKRASGDYYILPSSIHELLLIPSKRDDEKSEVVRKMVFDVNSDKNCVSDDYFLSNNIFFYDGENLTTV